MLFIKYIIGMIVGLSIGTVGISIILTVLRFGIPMCNGLLANKEYDKETLKSLKHSYEIAVFIWSIIIAVVSVLCYKFLGRGIIGYIITVALSILRGYNATGNNNDNMLEFSNSLQCRFSMLHHDKCEEISSIAMQGLDISNIDDALTKMYKFYKENEVDLKSINLGEPNKYETLTKMLMLGLETNDINEVEEKLITFYKEQGIEIKI